MFTIFDTDKSGSINFREFLFSMLRNLKGSSEEKLGWAFRMYDMDGNGSISLDEMKR